MTIYTLDLRSLSYDGSVVPARVTDDLPSAALAFQTATRIIFLVHGFNVPRSVGTTELRAFAQNLSRSDGNDVYIAVLWPGDALIRAVSSALGGIGYPFEVKKADDSAHELAKFIGDTFTRDQKISFVAHSLGSRVVMQTVDYMRQARFPVDEVCLMAAAIDNDSLASRNAFRAATEHARRLFALHSQSDSVLKNYYPWGTLFAAFPHFSTNLEAALGFTGPKGSAAGDETPASVWPVKIPKAAGIDHGDYLPDQDGKTNGKQSAVAHCIGSALQGQQQPSYP